MNFSEICKERYSVRSFSPEKVEESKVDAMLNLARLAPTAMNGQPYEIFVAQSDAAIEKLKEASNCLFGSTTVFIICKDQNKSWNNRVSGEEEVLQDIGIITTTLMYAAVEQGLGATYVCAFDPQKIKKAFGLPENLIPESLLPVGYAAKDATPSPRHGLRREINEFVHKI